MAWGVKGWNQAKAISCISMDGKDSKLIWTTALHGFPLPWIVSLFFSLWWIEIPKRESTTHSLGNILLKRYYKISHRLLKLQPKYAINPTPLSLANDDFDLLNRQVIWQAFTEFFIFAAPFFRFQKLQKLFSKILYSIIPIASFKGRQDDSPDDVCLICKDSGYPRTTIHQPRLTNCGHCFCYYCLVSQMMADPSFSCPRCGTTVTDIHLPPVKL